MYSGVVLEEPETFLFVIPFLLLVNKLTKCFIGISGVKVFIDSKAQMTLLGSEMDFITDKLQSEFVFNNPNIKGTCGCGESFNV